MLVYFCVRGKRIKSSKWQFSFGVQVDVRESWHNFRVVHPYCPEQCPNVKSVFWAAHYYCSKASLVFFSAELVKLPWKINRKLWGGQRQKVTTISQQYWKIGHFRSFVSFTDNRTDQNNSFTHFIYHEESKHTSRKNLKISKNCSYRVSNLNFWQKNSFESSMNFI